MIDTKPNLKDGKFEQGTTDYLHLSGLTHVYGNLTVQSGGTIVILSNGGLAKVLTSDTGGTGTWKVIPTALITGATNGLGITNKNVCLGGTLLNNTTINITNKDFYICSSVYDDRGICVSNANDMVSMKWTDTGNTCYNMVTLRSNDVTIASAYGGGGCSAEIGLAHIDNRICFNSAGDYRTYHDQCGLWYTGNYSSGATARWLPDKGYVDSIVSGDTTSERITKLICQTSHEFLVGNVVGWSGGTYNKAIADGTYDGEVLGIVSYCYNANCFDLTESGYVSGLTSLTTDTTYFLSPTVYGSLTATEPTTDGYISKAVLIANSTTSGWVLSYPGYYITSGTTVGIVNACNGLSSDGVSVCLGGTIVANTNIMVSDTKILTFGLTDTNLQFLRICSGGTAIQGFTGDYCKYTTFNVACSFIQSQASDQTGGLQYSQILTSSQLSAPYTQITTCDNITNRYTHICVEACNMTIAGNSTFGGVKYQNDYSTNFTARSLVDAAYVTGKTSTAGLQTACNGLTKQDSMVKLGGALTGTTTINGAQILNINQTILNLSGNTSINLTFSGGTITNTSNYGGLRYAGDYSAYYNNRSLVDKEYVDTGITASTIYNLQSPSAVNLCGITIGYVLTGKTVSCIIQDLLVPELFQTSITNPSESIVISPSTTPLEIGCVLTTLTATGTFNCGIINPQYCSASSCRSGSANRYYFAATYGTGIAGVYVCTASSVAKTNNNYQISGGNQTWNVCTRYDAGSQPKGSKGTNTPTYSPLASGITSAASATICGILPWYWGKKKVTNVIDCTDIAAGTKVVTVASGTLSITYNSASDDYLWFAVPNGTAVKTAWFVCASNQGVIGGVNNLFATCCAVTVTSGQGCWSGCGYMVYASCITTATAASIPMCMS